MRSSGVAKRRPALYKGPRHHSVKRVIQFGFHRVWSQRLLAVTIDASNVTDPH